MSQVHEDQDFTSSGGNGLIKLGAHDYTLKITISISFP